MMRPTVNSSIRQIRSPDSHVSPAAKVLFFLLTDLCSVIHVISVCRHGNSCNVHAFYSGGNIENKTQRNRFGFVTVAVQDTGRDNVAVRISVRIQLAEVFTAAFQHHRGSAYRRSVFTERARNRGGILV